MSTPFDPPIVCELTPPGRGGVSTIGYRGNVARLDHQPLLFRPARGGTLAELPLEHMALGAWGVEHPEDIVVCRVSPTVVELHCHGGRAAVERIITDILARGAMRVESEAWLTASADWLDSELTQTLLRATTRRVAGILQNQRRGALRRALQQIQQSLEKDINAGDPTSPSTRGPLENLLAWARFGQRLTEGWKVAVCGRPNVGKSSLINALAGFQRSIVTPIPGTTRDVVSTEIVLDGWPITLLDTAGFRDTSDPLEAEGIARARHHLETVDLQILILEAGAALTPEEVALCHQFPNALLVSNKSDLTVDPQPADQPPAHRVSALTGLGMEALMAEMVRRLVPQVPSADTGVPVTTRIVNRLLGLRDLLAAGATEAAWASLHEMLGSPKEAPAG